MSSPKKFEEPISSKKEVPALALAFEGIYRDLAKELSQADKSATQLTISAWGVIMS